MEARGAKVVQVIEGQAGLKHVSAGDFVISLRSFQGGIEWSAGSGKISPAYTVLSPRREVVERYFVYLLKSHGFIQELRSTSNQLRDGQSLGLDHFSQVPLPLPPTNEQVAISRFLDRETAKIDALVAKQEQLITTLREDRTATITHAVTKGLDPDVEMKDSGVEWLDHIPSHWETTRLGWVVDRIVDCAHSTPIAHQEGEYTVVRSGSIRDGKYRPEYSFQTNRTVYLERVERAVPTPGDIFFTREAPAGEACVIPDLSNLCLGQRMVLLKTNDTVYLSDLIVQAIYSRSIRAYFDVQLNGSTVGNLKMDRIAKTPLPYPPIDEQRRIVAFLNERCTEIDVLIDKANDAITMLHEYRSALITEAVTGKIDVRGAVA
ncbi:restriction endonuclease subunit S [Mycolicibacterium sediminis]|nr:restriction endonuclease subunit S [Mycolicibacterium sediminis]